MKILHVYRTFYEDKTGIPHVIHCLANAEYTHDHSKIEHDVLFLASNPENIQHTYHNYHLSPFSRQFRLYSLDANFSDFFTLRKKLRTADIVHFHFPWPYMDLLWFGLSKKKPKSIVTYHSDIIRQKYFLPFYRPLLHRFLNSVDVIVATSENYVRSSSTIQKYASKTKIIPLGLPDYQQKYPVQHITSISGIDIPENFFLFVGSTRYYKGLEILIEAASQQETTVIIAGEGSERAALEEKVKKLNASVKFVGWVSEEEKFQLLRQSLAFVFPSNQRSEAYGLSLLEAAMFGKALICCDINTGTTFINQHGETGLVVPPHDATALANAMNRLRWNPQLREDYGLAARMRYETHLRQEKMIESYNYLYSQLS